MKINQAQLILRILLAAVSWFACGLLWAGTEGSSSTFYGQGAGAAASADNGGNTFIGLNAGNVNGNLGVSNVFLGRIAGAFNVSGYNNTFVGTAAGYLNTTGLQNTFVGVSAGYGNTTGNTNSALGAFAGRMNSTGQGNVFLGFYAGYSETSSNKLYIDNCASGGGCTSPFIYGEFDNHLLKINGVTNVAANNVAKSQMHFSLANADSGGFLTSVLENNFFVSSGARYDATAGGWIQRSSDQQSVIAGSGGVGYRIFTDASHAVGNNFTPTVRLHIDYSGQFGINTAPVAGHEIHTSSGAYLAGGTWTDASSRDYKERIETLSTEEALQALGALNPVKFRYKVDPQEQHVGFIAEDVPNLVARGDRKGLSPMDIVAVLTKVVQEQKQALEEMKAELASLKAQNQKEQR